MLRYGTASCHNNQNRKQSQYLLSQNSQRQTQAASTEDLAGSIMSWQRSRALSVGNVFLKKLSLACGRAGMTAKPALPQAREKSLCAWCPVQRDAVLGAAKAALRYFT